MLKQATTIDRNGPAVAHFADASPGPQGSGTTVMISADCPTKEGDASFTPDGSGGRGLVPCFLYDSDQDLSKLQKTRGQAIATSGELNLVDVINYLRAQVVRTFPPQIPRKDVPEAGH